MGPNRVAVVMEVQGGKAPYVVLRADLTEMYLQDPCQTEMVGQMLSLLVQDVTRRKNLGVDPSLNEPIPFSDCKGAIFIMTQPLFPLLGIVDAVVGKREVAIQWEKGTRSGRRRISASGRWVSGVLAWLTFMRTMEVARWGIRPQKFTL